MKYVLTAMVLVSGFAYGQTCTNVPLGASKLGYTKQLFYDQPTLADVSATDTDSTSKWYPGAFSAPVSRNLTERELLSTVDGELVLSLGGGVSSETHTSQQGALPLLSGANGFYVEFAMRLSSNNGDHFTGLFLQTQEHDLARHDHLPTDPAGFERWTEIDVSEAGYGPGSLATVIDWSGEYPHYHSVTANNYGHDLPLDWTVEHRFGVSYNPATNILQWYIDDVPTFTKSPTDDIMQKFHYYLVMESGSHGSHVPYDMYIHYVQAYTK